MPLRPAWHRVKVAGTMPSTRAPRSAELALSRRAGSVELIICNNAGGALDVLRFADTAALERALAGSPHNNVLCQMGRTLIVDDLFYDSSAIGGYCRRLGGTLLK